MTYSTDRLKTELDKIYGKDDFIIKQQLNRYKKLLKLYRNKFNNNAVQYFSAPGRAEIGGNHTDHNNGRVLAAAINLDSVAIAAKNKENIVNLYSANYQDTYKVNLNKLSPELSEKGKTPALIRGIAARIKELGYTIGGFNAVLSSDVLVGSGLSSSASIEVLIGSIFNHMYNGGEIPIEEVAKIGQFSENNYFDKPCGLMDQITSAVGGIVCIDFENPDKPEIEKLDFDFERHGYQMLVVNSGSSHSDLTEDYAAIPYEMKSVAQLLGGRVLRQFNREDVLSQLHQLQEKCGDRAVLRSLHFINENQRVLDQVEALESANVSKFLKLVNESGTSSFRWLQNIYSLKNVKEQGLSLALEITEEFIQQKGDGACRVHGGGFAGTILVVLPILFVSEYKNLLTSVYSENRVIELHIRSYGAIGLMS